MDTHLLKGFIAVAREKNFSRAAKKIHRTQSAVSLQVKALEEDLKVRLFDRISPRHTELTAEGALLLELAAPLVEDLETLSQKFDDLCDNISTGEIRIATHEPVITYILPGPIRAFKKTYPNVKITLLRKDREGIISAVTNGEVDFGISSLKTVPATIDYSVIGRYDRILVAPRDHPLSRKRGIRPEDLAKYPLLLPPSESSTRKVVDQVFTERGLEYELALEATGRQAIKVYIEMGFGISIFNEMIISKEEKRKFFTANMAKFFGYSERAIIKRKGKYLSKPLSTLIRMLSGGSKASLV